VRTLPAATADAAALAAELPRLVRFRPARAALDLDGAQRSAEIVAVLAERPAPAVADPVGSAA